MCTWRRGCGGQQVFGSAPRLKQGAHAGAGEVGSADELEREQSLAGSAEQCREPDRRGRDPARECECDAGRGQDHSTPAMGKRVVRHYRHVRPGRDRKQKRHADERQKLGFHP